MVLKILNFNLLARRQDLTFKPTGKGILVLFLLMMKQLKILSMTITNIQTLLQWKICSVGKQKRVAPIATILVLKAILYRQQSN